ncbi:sensor domain-containing diguanylate cyclase [Tamilnaduibacter salinus]|nr:diguanylate cyclase [Tamilnaduibacter salinus]
MTNSTVIMTRFLLFLALAVLVVAPTQAGEPLTLNAFFQKERLASHVERLQEADASTDLEAVRALPDSAWTPNGEQSVNLGYTDQAHWFRFTVRNAGVHPVHSLLEISYPVLDHIEIYLVADDSVRDQLVVGDKQPFYARPVRHRNFVVPLDVPSEHPTHVYMRVETTSSLQLPMTLWRQEAFYAAEQTNMLFEGAYYGIVLVMILYNLFVFLAVGERSFLYYVGYITAMPLFLASLHGLAFQYLWPEATWWNDQSIIVFLNLVVVFGAVFSMRFLSVIPSTHPLLARATSFVAVVAGAAALLGLVVPYTHMIVPTIVIAAVGCTGVIVLSIVRWLKNDPAARYYGIAWFFMLFGGIVLALNKLTILPQNYLTENATQVGSALGVILLSIALADRLNKEKQRAFQAQERLYREERKARMAQEESLRVQQEANATLEERVQERTRDLETLNERLRELNATDALTGLKNRGHFDRAFQSFCVKAFRFGKPLSVMVIDIDHFKSFNDTYGHLVGDDCLQMVSQGIQRYVTRPQDLAARYGGEEFVVLLPDTPEEGARSVAEKIREEIGHTDFRVSDDVLNLTVSIGVCSQIPDRADQAKELFEVADNALYIAKTSGRNQVVVANSQTP